ncbi:hypothetical protein FrEUN1fDRAFT_4179 [Parafrankia sp. EUN1f]|nr:hypothetical protein FrEUN1fDRAFT_4179 [Parafrankia sp. EUN1f]
MGRGFAVRPGAVRPGTFVAPRRRTGTEAAATPLCVGLRPLGRGALPAGPARSWSA